MRLTICLQQAEGDIVPVLDVISGSNRDSVAGAGVLGVHGAMGGFPGVKGALLVTTMITIASPPLFSPAHIGRMMGGGGGDWKLCALHAGAEGRKAKPDTSMLLVRQVKVV